MGCAPMTSTRWTLGLLLVLGTLACNGEADDTTPDGEAEADVEAETGPDADSPDEADTDRGKDGLRESREAAGEAVQPPCTTRRARGGMQGSPASPG